MLVSLPSPPMKKEVNGLISSPVLCPFANRFFERGPFAFAFLAHLFFSFPLLFGADATAERGKRERERERERREREEHSSALRAHSPNLYRTYRANGANTQRIKKGS